MPVRIAADENGKILYSEGDTGLSYGIASLSKVWSSVLIHNRMRDVADQRKISLDAIHNEPILVAVDYGAMVYSRMAPRPDLEPPDDPMVYRPFRKEKLRQRLPVEKGKSYRLKELVEASLFQSKNDAIQALADHFFANDDNRRFREASNAMAHGWELPDTKIGDPHGLCDGDNVSTGKDLAKFCAALIREGHMEFFARFNPIGKAHTADVLFKDHRLTDAGIEILLAKTATGNNRQGNDYAESLMVIAKKRGQLRIAIALSDEDKFNKVSDMLLN